MSALAEALVAAQRRAVSVLEKAYVGNAVEGDLLRATLTAIGCTDQDYLVNALDVVRRYGGPLPAEPRPNGDEPAKATDAQVKFAQSLFQRAEPPRERVSQLIESLKAGTYDASAWDVPF